ncbi:MAG TPA: LLM class flavin-dependent oxidoreductase [Candidatus Limnocylindrales bacterium]|nr:LLM class flavin-dependent oxidoreductase [Candidatus Limnocylindrales bacterium]
MAVTRPRVSFGIKTSQANTTYAEIQRIWREADQVAVFEHAWLWDHLVPLRGDVTGPALEAWTLLAALAAQTTRLRLGIIVTNNRIRQPAVLAKMAATVDIIAGGRLEFGIGAGGSAVADPAGLALVHRELDAYGIEVVAPGEAVGALGEACTIIKRLWTEDTPFDFEGRYYQLKGAICEPKPVQRPGPPITIGAGGERLALRVVAEQADIWNCPTRGDIAEFRRKSAVLDDHCAAIGRDPGEITRSVQILVATTAAGGASPNADVLPRFFDPAATQDLIHGLIEAGARHFVLAPVGFLSPQALADDVVEPVLAALR